MIEEIRRSLTLNLELDETLVTGLKQLVRVNGGTLFMIFLASWNVLLARCTGQEEIITGIPVAGRRHPDLTEMIGMFLNTLALRNEPALPKPFASFTGKFGKTP